MGKTSSWPSLTGGADQFTVYKVHGLIHGKQMYYVASKRWPSWIISMRSTAATAFSPFGLFALDLDHEAMPWEPQGLLVHICQMKEAGFTDAIQIMSPGTLSTAGLVSKAYIHHGSWLVYGWEITSDPGTGGYWTASAKIPGLQAC